MPSSVFKEILIEFQGKADELASKIPQTTSSTSSDKGTQREGALLNLIENHLPSRSGVHIGGYVFDSEGDKSKQIDLIVATDSTLKFRTSKDSFAKTNTCVEGCLCAISVKSKLNKKELIDSIDNLASISTEKKYSSKNPFIENIDEQLEKLPLKVIFAYEKGKDIRSLLVDLKNHVDENNIEDNKKPDFIIVNNEFIAEKIKKGQKSIRTNEILPEGKYAIYSKENTKFVGGRSLWTLLTRIQQYGDIADEADIDFNHYYEQIKLSDDTWKVPN